MLILAEFFKTQSDQKMHQNTPNFKIFSGELENAREPPSIGVQL